MSATATLPSVIPNGFAPAKIVLPEESTTPYVVFLNAKARCYTRVLQEIPTARENDTILVLPKPEKPLKLSPLRFFFVGAFQFWAKYNQDGEIVEYTEEKPPKDSGLTETLESLLIVTVDRGNKVELVPASASFRGPKAAAALAGERAKGEAETVDTVANEAYQKAMSKKGTTDEAARKIANEARLESTWAQESEHHAATVAIPFPWQRFTVKVQKGQERTSAIRVGPDGRKTGGFKYCTVDTVIEPTPLVLYKSLLASFSDPEFVAKFNAVKTNVEERINKARAKGRVEVAA